MELYSDEMFEFQNLRLLFYQFLTFYHELLSICENIWASGCNSEGGVTKPKRHSQIVVSSLTVKEEVYPYFAATDAVLDLAIKASLFFV